MYNTEASHAVHWYMNEMAARVVAQSGNPEDRHHLGKLIMQGFKLAPDFILQIDGATGESETFELALQRSIRCASAFRNAGLKTHDVILIMAPNHIHVTTVMYGGFYTGVGTGCVDMTLKVGELKDTFSFIQPKMVFCQMERALDVQQVLDELSLKSGIVTFDKGVGFCSFAEFLETHGDDERIENFIVSDLNPEETVALLISTGGTTGLPKAAAVTHKNLAVSIPYMWLIYDNFPTPVEKVIILSPLQWYSAIFKFVFAPIVRVTRIQSSAEVTTGHAYFLINKYKPNLMMTSPSMLTALLKPGERDKCDFTSFKTILCGGGAPHSTLLDDMMAASPNTETYVIYGMSELSGIALDYSCPLPGSCGRALGNYKHKLVDPATLECITEPNKTGELWVKGPGVFKGYYNNPEMTATTLTDGWLRTGDLFRRDENWNFFFVERLKTLLKYRNHHVSPTEVEDVIKKHPGVFDVAVTGIPDKEVGDLVVACVVPHAGRDVTAQEIKDMVKESLTDTKQLRGGVIFLEQLPLTSASKIDRPKLAAIARQMHRS